MMSDHLTMIETCQAGALAQQNHKVSLHTILIGVMGTIYICNTELPFSKLGLDT